MRENRRPRGKASRGGRRENNKGSLILCFLLMRKLLMVGFFCEGIVLPCLSNAFSVFFFLSAFLLLHLRKVTGNIHQFHFAYED